jgi:hypothetical protein
MLVSNKTMNDQILSVVRTILKVVGTAAATKGLIGESQSELVIGAIVTLVGVGLSWKKHSAPAPAPVQPATN